MTGLKLFVIAKFGDSQENFFIIVKTVKSFCGGPIALPQGTPVGNHWPEFFDHGPNLTVIFHRGLNNQKLLIV